MHCACSAEHKRWRLSTSSDWLIDRPTVRSRDHRSRDNECIWWWLTARTVLSRCVGASYPMSLALKPLQANSVSLENSITTNRRRDKIIVCLRGTSIIEKHTDTAQSCASQQAARPDSFYSAAVLRAVLATENPSVCYVLVLYPDEWR